MEEIFEFFKSDQRLLYAVVFIVLLVLFYVLVKLFVGKSKDDYDDEDDLDEDDDNLTDRDDDEGPEDRFFRIPSYDLPEDWSETFEVIVDRETKVQYLCSTEGYGLTPLIDSEGKPILYKDKYENQDEQGQDE